MVRATHIAQRYWRVADGSGRRARAFALASALGQLLGALALAPIFIAILGVAILLGWLPVPQIRGLIVSLQSTLTATVGDRLAFVESPIRAALIRTRVLDRLRRLTQLCGVSLLGGIRNAWENGAAQNQASKSAHGVESLTLNLDAATTRAYTPAPEVPTCSRRGETITDARNTSSGSPLLAPSPVGTPVVRHTPDPSAD